MKVTVVSKKGLKTDLRVTIDKKTIIFLVSVQVDILVRPYTMDFIAPAKILNLLNS